MIKNTKLQLHIWSSKGHIPFSRQSHSPSISQLPTKLLSHREISPVCCYIVVLFWVSHIIIEFGIQPSFPQRPVHDVIVKNPLRVSISVRSYWITHHHVAANNHTRVLRKCGRFPRNWGIGNYEWNKAGTFHAHFYLLFTSMQTTVSNKLYFIIRVNCATDTFKPSTQH